MRTTLAILALILAPPAAQAQTGDVLFGGYTWRARDPGSRPGGLAGAYVAVADSVRTAPVNPAGLALIPDVELAAGVGALWGGLAVRIERTPPHEPTRPTEAAVPVPCPPGRRARPWALALYAEQSATQASALEVVHGPGIGEASLLEATSEELGTSVAKGLTPWLDVGATVAFRHLRLDGRSVISDELGREQQRLIVAGDANKARAIVGLLASFGPSWSPTAFRIGVAYQRDLIEWEVERTLVDRARGEVAEGPTLITIQEPPVLSAGLAWRLSDAWLVSGQVDYTWFTEVERALEGPGRRFTIEDHFEPRLAVEMTRPSPIGGYYKLRVGVRREISGRAAFEGDDPVLRQAFIGSPAAFRAAAGFSFLAEFYERGVRLDIDLSQVVLERQSTLTAAGTRRLSIGLTARL